MTGPLPRLLGLVFPACAGEGAAGLPMPTRLDFATLRRPRPPNSALAAPPGLWTEPDIFTRARRVAPEKLYRLLKAVALAQPRTVLHAEYAAELQAHFVARSRLCNFPDLIAMQVTPDAMPALYSRSLCGHADFGVNRRRLITWLAALDAAIDHA